MATEFCGCGSLTCSECASVGYVTDEEDWFETPLCSECEMVLWTGGPMCRECTEREHQSQIESNFIMVQMTYGTFDVSDDPHYIDYGNGRHLMIVDSGFKDDAERDAALRDSVCTACDHNVCTCFADLWCDDASYIAYQSGDAWANEPFELDRYDTVLFDDTHQLQKEQGYTCWHYPVTDTMRYGPNTYANTWSPLTEQTQVESDTMETFVTPMGMIVTERPCPF